MDIESWFKHSLRNNTHFLFRGDEYVLTGKIAKQTRSRKDKEPRLYFQIISACNPSPSETAWVEMHDLFTIEEFKTNNTQEDSDESR